MIPWLTSAKYVREHIVWLAFNDGSSGYVDLSSELDGEIFEPLKDELYFMNFTITGHTLAWENGADFAPEFLRERITEPMLSANKNES